MIDLKFLRDFPDRVRKALLDKGIKLDLDRVLLLDLQYREMERQLIAIREERNQLTAEIKTEGGAPKPEQLKRGREIAATLAEQKKAVFECRKQLDELLLKLPGIPHGAVPCGLTDEDNRELYRRGRFRPPEDTPLDHLELGRIHGLFDLDGAVNVAGTRAYALKGYGALLENAVLRLAYDMVYKKGFQPLQVPVMVRHHAMEGTGYFPFGEDNAYRLEKDNLYLTGTAEVGMLAMQANRCFEMEQLPLKLFGMTTCFRREAGAAGRDTRGLYRVHQFQKVEQVIICDADQSKTERLHQELLENAELILEALELPYRVVECCTGELGLGQVRKFDIETWMPGRNAFGETHSCSNFLEFQARRLNIKYINGQGEKRFVHTLNNTAIATPRILIALLENHQREGGAIYIPRALRPYLDGLEELET